MPSQPTVLVKKKYFLWKICAENWSIKKAPLKDETIKKCSFLVILD